MKQQLDRSQLKSAGVTFDAGPHTYTRNADGKLLQGVTKMIQQQLYPDEFAHIDPATLAAKAEWGTRRHREIQDMIVFGDTPDTSAQKAFTAMMSEAELTPLASEYTVTDGSEFASNIDVVCTDGSLIDIKTVASLNRAKVSWQLSLYAMMFELTNPGLKAGRLLVAWIPKTGTPRLVEVPRRPDSELQRLMQSWLSNEPYTPSEESLLNREAIERAAALKMQIEQLQEEYNRCAAEILAQMKEKGETTWSDDFCTVSFRAASVSKRFDSASFKKADPATYALYLRESATAETISLRLK